MAESRLGYMLMLDDNNGANDFEQVRVELHSDQLILRRDASNTKGKRNGELNRTKNGVTNSTPAAHNDSDSSGKERTVVIHREPSGLGISVKGGSENQIPVLVSKIYPGQAADKTGQLSVGDIIMQVNGENMEKATHDDVVNALKNSGDSVTLVVRHLKAVTPYLKQVAANNNNPSEASTNELESSEKSPETSSDQSSSSLYEAFTEQMTIPLEMASLSRYKTGEEILRDGFEVVSHDETVSATLFANQPDELTSWYNSIKGNITMCTKQAMKLANTSFPADEQVLFMNWVWERRNDARHNHMWQRRFLTLKGSEMMIFDRPPNTDIDWLRRDCAYPLVEIALNICKQDDLLDRRQQCFTIQNAQKKRHYFGVDTHADLLDWTNKIINSVRIAVERAKIGGSPSVMTSWAVSINKHFFDYSMKFADFQHCFQRLKENTNTYEQKVKVYPGSWKGTRVRLHLNYKEGLKLLTSDDKTLLWSYKFSQLCGSSDDGNNKLTLMFKPRDGQVERIVIDFPNLHEVILALLSFYSAKIAEVDPDFFKRV